MSQWRVSLFFTTLDLQVDLCLRPSSNWGGRISLDVDEYPEGLFIARITLRSPSVDEVDALLQLMVGRVPLVLCRR